MTNFVIIILNLAYCSIYAYAVYQSPDNIPLVLAIAGLSLVFSIVAIIYPFDNIVIIDKPEKENVHNQAE